jgi:hypothetical protein
MKFLREVRPNMIKNETSNQPNLISAKSSLGVTDFAANGGKGCKSTLPPHPNSFAMSHVKLFLKILMLSVKLRLLLYQLFFQILKMMLFHNLV